MHQYETAICSRAARADFTEKLTSEPTAECREQKRIPSKKEAGVGFWGNFSTCSWEAPGAGAN